MTKEALKLALGYVERNCPALVFKEIKEALAQQEQEPVAWMHEWEDGERIPLMYSSDSRDNDEPVSVRPLVYGDTTPPKRLWADLTDEEISEYLGHEYHTATKKTLYFFKLGLQAAKEKNT